MSNLKSKLLTFFLSILTFFSNPIVTLAKPADPCIAIGGCIEGIDKYKSNGVFGSGPNSIVKFVIDISNILVYIAVGVAVLVIIFAGYKMLASNGNDEQFKKGKQTLVYAVIGLFVAIVAATIVVLVSGISGFRLN
jgi:type IV secretory pathway VirB2 component (pilin)